jgi:hypothetical protein
LGADIAMVIGPESCLLMTGIAQIWKERVLARRKVCLSYCSRVCVCVCVRVCVDASAVPYSLVQCGRPSQPVSCRPHTYRLRTVRSLVSSSLPPAPPNSLLSRWGCDAGKRVQRTRRKRDHQDNGGSCVCVCVCVCQCVCVCVHACVCIQSV